jgi:hypothetical protein
MKTIPSQFSGRFFKEIMRNKLGLTGGLAEILSTDYKGIEMK